MSYNGQKNWETWITKIYFGDAFDEAAEEYASNGGEDPSELEDIFSGIVESELEYSGLDGYLKELVEAELEEIDYGELAESFYRDASSVRSNSPRSRKAPAKKKKSASKTTAKKKSATKKARR